MGKRSHAVLFCPPVTKRLTLVLAFSLAAACGLVLVGLASPALAAESARPPLESYDIAAGPLEQALNQFGRQAGILLSFPPDLVASRQSPGLHGRYDVGDSLQALLEGTGLEAVERAGGGYIVRERVSDSALQTISVLAAPLAQLGGEMPAYSGGQVATGGRLGVLGDMDLMDAPFNVTSYTAQTIEDQQARSIADLLVANDTSVRVVGGRGDIVDTFLIRGFPVDSQDMALNGLYGVLPYWRVPIEFAERVEVLKGPSALLGGMPPGGSVGGNINVVPKRAADRPLTRLSLDYTSDSQVGGHLDVGRRFGEENRFGVRFNGVYRNGDTAVDHQEREFPLASLGLDFRGERLRLSADFLYQKESLNGVSRPVMIGQATRVPHAPDSDKLFGQRNSYLDQEDLSVVTQGEFDLTSTMTAFASFGGRQSDYDTIAANVTMTAAGNGDMENSWARQRADRRTYSSETGLRGSFESGPIRHQWTLSANRLWHKEGSVYAFFDPVPGNLYAPPIVIDTSGSETLDGHIPKTGESVLSGVTLTDRLFFLDDRLQLTLGGRRQWIDTHSYDATTGMQIASYDKQVWTPLVGVAVEPLANLTFYANVIQGLSQGDTAPASAVNAGEMMAPYKTQQYELGAKYDQGSFTTTFSVFQIKKPGAILGTDNVYRSDGEQRNRGVELSVFGEPLNGLRVLSGFTYLQPVLTHTSDGVDQGKDAQGVPRKQLNLGLSWDVPYQPGLSLDGRWIYTDSSYLDTANTLEVPEWHRFDVGARYRFNAYGTPMVVGANIENLLNEDYWMASSGYMTISSPRTLTLSLSMDL